MFINICIAGIILRLEPQRPLHISPEFAPFLTADSAKPDITVRVSWDWKEADVLHSAPLGRDLLLIYYREGGYCYCEMDGGDRPPIAQTKYTPDFSLVSCVINTDEFDVPQDHIRQILRMLPLRQILLAKDVLFLHSSQVLHQNKGILFCGPSGTGKTTQAKLWRDHRNAQIICNDRTLLRKEGNGWMTYGYPYDGSDPVGSNQRHSLGAIVVLRQGSENKIVRLKPVKAITRLMGQAIIDGWDPVSRGIAIENIALLLGDIPVYELTCTISEEAVTVLENTLLLEGIING